MRDIPRGLNHSRQEKPTISDDPVLAALARLETGLAEMQTAQARMETAQARMETELAQTQTALTRMETAQARMEAEQTRLREQLNHKLDKIAAVRVDADNTRAHVLYGLPENLSLSQRIT